MNNYDELIEYGYTEYTAKAIITDNSKRIGTLNGVYEVIDVTFIPETKEKKVVLKCTKCGKIIERVLVHSKNKWCELIKTCECEKIEREIKRLENKELKKQEREKILKMQKDARLAKKQASYDEWWNSRNHYGEEYIGKKNNFLTIKRIEYTDGKKRFVCACDCGGECKVEPNMWFYGKVKSCGCRHDELVSTHGLSKERIYGVWQGMIDRCENPHNNNYHNYGGRGIKVCQEWHDVREFAYWAMLTGYNETAKHGDCTIDRINVNGNYEPSNCRWVDMKIQNSNRRPKEECGPRKRKMYEYNGRFYNIDELAKIANKSANAIKYRITRGRMSIKQAVEMPLNNNGRPRKEAI